MPDARNQPVSGETTTLHCMRKRLVSAALANATTRGGTIGRPSGKWSNDYRYSCTLRTWRGFKNSQEKTSQACIGAEEASPRGISLRFGKQTNHSKTKLNPRTVATPSAVRTPNRRERLAQVRVKIGRFGLAGPQPPPDKPQQCYQARAGTMRASDRSRQTTEAGRVFSLAPIGATAACFLHPLRRYYP